MTTYYTTRPVMVPGRSYASGQPFVDGDVPAGRLQALLDSGALITAEAAAAIVAAAGSGTYAALRNRSGLGRLLATDVGAARLDPLVAPMASPPTLTYGTTFGSPTIASAVTIPLPDPRIRRLGLGPAQTWTSFGSGGFTYWNAGVTQEKSVARYEFETDAPNIEINTFGVMQWMATVDGAPISAAPLDSSIATTSKVNGDRYYTKLAFSSRKMRRITLFGKLLQIASIVVGPNDTVAYPSWPNGPRLGVMADSYGQTSSALGGGGLYLSAAAALGWTDVVMSAVGGTGYLNNNTTYTTFRGRIADITAAAPDVVLTAGGINDQSRQTKAVLQAETTLYFAALRSALPNAVLVALGPWAPSQTSGASANYTDVRDAVLAGLTAAGGSWLFIDNLAGTWVASDARTGSTGGIPWQTGTGFSGTTTGTGNGDVYVKSDGTHPTDAVADDVITAPPVAGCGTDYLAARLAQALGAGLGLN